MDNGDERTGYRLPGVRTTYADNSFDVDYDIPLALYDCRLDDGVTPHKDAHNGNGETHPEWWGKSYFRHFPNHGFVGDVFTVNGTAYPVMEVKRRKYRLRFLDCSISRIYNLQLMTGHPKAARDLGYTGDELQGQYRLPDGEQCMKWVQIANEGGLLPKAIIRDSFELWPAKRREFVVDFSRYQDGTPTKKGDEIYLVDTMKMTTGRMWDPADPAYKVPMMKIVIGDTAPDYSLPGIDVLKPSDVAKISLREVPDMVPGAVAAIKDNSIPTFELQRGSSNADPETEWLINGQQFEPDKPLIGVPKDSARRVADPQRRRRLGPPVPPPHGGAPGGGPQRQAGAGRAPPGRHGQGGRHRARPERGGRDLPPVPDLHRPVRGPLPQPGPRGPQHDVRLGDPAQDLRSRTGSAARPPSAQCRAMEPPSLSGRGGGSPITGPEAGGAAKPAGLGRFRHAEAAASRRPVPRAAIE